MKKPSVICIEERRWRFEIKGSRPNKYDTGIRNDLSGVLNSANMYTENQEEE
jgi:hypothetical protein